MKVRGTYVLAALALFVMAIATPIAIAQEGLGAGLVGLGSATVVGLLMRHEWRRDRRAAAMFLSFFTGTAVFICGAIVVLFPDMRWGPAGAFLLLAFLATAVLVQVLWGEHRMADQRPDWTTRFVAGPIFEDDGVQWQLTGHGSDLTHGVRVTIYLQNNIEAARDVRIRFRDEHGMLGRTGFIDYPLIDPVSLAAGGQATVEADLVADEERQLDKIRLYVLVSAVGPAGPRNRRRRGEPGPRPTPKWVAVIAPIAGLIVLDRGGVLLQLHASGGPPTAEADARVIVEDGEQS